MKSEGGAGQAHKIKGHAAAEHRLFFEVVAYSGGLDAPFIKSGMTNKKLDPGLRRGTVAAGNGRGGER